MITSGEPSTAVTGSGTPRFVSAQSARNHANSDGDRLRSVHTGPMDAQHERSLRSCRLETSCCARGAAVATWIDRSRTARAPADRRAEAGQGRSVCPGRRLAPPPKYRQSPMLAALDPRPQIGQKVGASDPSVFRGWFRCAGSLKLAGYRPQNELTIRPRLDAGDRCSANDAVSPPSPRPALPLVVPANDSQQSSAPAVAPPSAAHGLILHNATILTMDEANPSAEAVLIRDGNDRGHR